MTYYTAYKHIHCRLQWEYFWYFILHTDAGDVIDFVVGLRRWGFCRRTRWMDVSVVRWITVCFLSRPGSFRTQSEAGSNLAKSVFHLSLEQTGAGEPAPIYHQCEIPAPLNLILKQQMDACRMCVRVCVRFCWKRKQLFCCTTRKDAGLHSSWIYQDTQSLKPTRSIMLIIISHVVNPQIEADMFHKVLKFHFHTIYQILLYIKKSFLKVVFSPWNGFNSLFLVYFLSSSSPLHPCCHWFWPLVQSLPSIPCQMFYITLHPLA